MTILGGAVAATLSAVIAARFGWESAIYAMMILTLVGALAWLKIDAGRPLFTKELSR